MGRASLTSPGIPPRLHVKANPAPSAPTTSDRTAPTTTDRTPTSMKRKKMTEKEVMRALRTLLFTSSTLLL